jgi:hypothetical protein
VAEHLVLASGDPQGLLLQRVEVALVDEEPDEMAGRTDRQLAQVVVGGGPVGERDLPGQSDQTG